MTYQEQLQAVITQLYDTFAPYEVQHPIAGSPMTVTSKMQENLAQYSLHEVPGTVLSTYLFKAMSTRGTVNDFKHYLPRILELLAWDAQSLVWGEVVYKKLPYANYHEWDAPETALIDKYTDVLWLYLLEKFPSRTISVIDFLESVDDRSRFSAIWETSVTESDALLHLAHFINYRSNILRRAFGDPRGVSLDLQWIVQPEILQRLDDAYLADMDGEYAEELSLASQNIKWALDFGES